MIKFGFDINDLLKFAMADTTKAIDKALADSLNQVGSGIVHDIARNIAETTGMHVDDIEHLFTVKRATISDPSFYIDASKAMAENAPAARRLPQRGFPTSESFASGALVRIQTREDNKVCQKCRDIAAAGPYTIEEANQILPVHIGPGGTVSCRCFVVPFTPLARVPVQFTTQMGTIQRARAMTIGQIADKVGKALEAELRIRLK